MSDQVYLGNPNLKKANVPVEFSQDQILEFIKCKDNPVYFAKNYIKIVSLDEGLVPFEMYAFQEKMLMNLVLKLILEKNWLTNFLNTKNLKKHRNPSAAWKMNAVNNLNAAMLMLK